jgi:hypothetical protein
LHRRYWGTPGNVIIPTAVLVPVYWQPEILCDMKGPTLRGKAGLELGTALASACSKAGLALHTSRFCEGVVSNTHHDLRNVFVSVSSWKSRMRTDREGLGGGGGIAVIVAVAVAVATPEGRSVREGVAEQID